MRARRRRLTITGALCAVALLFALWCGQASAKILLKGSFGSFSNVEAVAVDSSSGDVYVYDREQEAIFKFDAEGKPVNFSAVGSNEISGVGSPESYDESQLAVDESSGPAQGDLYLARGQQSVKVFSASGTELGEFANEGLGVACGVAVDRTGAVYVGIKSGQVNKYVPSGNPVTNADLASSIMGLFEPCDLAVDSAGNVFVAHKEGTVKRYEASQFGSLSPTGTVVDEFGSVLRTIGLDPGNDDLYVNEGHVVAQFGPHGEPFEEPLAKFGREAIEGSVGVAVNGVTHYIYVSKGYNGYDINVYASVTKPQAVTFSVSHVNATSATLNGTVTPDGFAVSSCRFDYGTSISYGQSVPCVEDAGSGEEAVVVHADIGGLSPGTAYHYRLVASNANGTAEGADQVFGTHAPPEVTGVGISHITDNEASVRAEVNPQGLATTYWVEYGPSESYGAHTHAIELGPQDTSGHPVTVELVGLTPGIAYHARMAAANALRTVTGPDGAFSTLQKADSSCSNDTLRTELSQRLPDCRAYELVSPPEKEGASTSEGLRLGEQLDSGEKGLLFKAARDGNSMYYVASGAIAGSPAGGQTYYQADRGASKWLTEPLTPPNLLETTPRADFSSVGIVGFYNYVSQDLACKIVQTAEPVTADTPQADISAGVRNLYRRNADGTYTLLTNVVPFNIHAESPPLLYLVLGASSDCKRILFKSIYQFVQKTPFLNDLYEWNEGTLRAADLLPDGELPLFGVDLSPGNETEVGKVSEEGSRVFFEALNSSFQFALFVRENNGSASAKTIEIAGPGFFQGASRSGSQVFFMDPPGLTSANRQSAGCDAEFGHGCDLYEFDVESEELTDLTVDTNPADTEGAGVLGTVGISDDGSYVYFMARGQLTPSSGDPSENTLAQNNLTHEANLYLAHAGVLSFVGRVNADDSKRAEDQTSPYSLYNDRLTWGRRVAARVTPDGRTLLFTSLSRLTGYDNTDGLLDAPDPEAYLYSADTGRIVCVSCNPSGARPVYESHEGRFNAARPIVPLSKSDSVSPLFGNQPRALSEDGTRVFFESTDRLSPLVKGKEDNVYEWEKSGSGTCTPSSPEYSEASGGCVFLLDSGLAESQAALPARFVDASANGDDVFLRTASKLLPQDEDGLADIYDVRVGGGLGVTQAGVPCEGEACQGLATAPPVFTTPSSASFSGSGNWHGTSSARAKPSHVAQARRLAHALKICARRKGKQKREKCGRNAMKRYGATAARGSAVRTGGRR